MIELEIDKETCIKCSKCVRVCPSHIMQQESPKSEISLINIDTCIACGHCVAICPTNSVLHSEFPAEKVHRFDRKMLPTPEQMLLICESRRSNRAFSSRPVPEDALNMILEAAHRAPTASNMQGVRFTLITSPEALKTVSDLTIKVFSSLAGLISNPVVKFFLKIFAPEIVHLLPQFNRLKNEYNKGEDLILRKATAVIIIHTPKGSRFGCQDSNLAYQNASLMAESLGVAHFYTGFVCAAVEQDKKKRQLAKYLGIEGDIQAGIALAMPDFRFTSYIDKHDIEVTRI